MSILEIRRLCVLDCPLSSTRAALMESLEFIVSLFLDEGVEGEIWLDVSLSPKKSALPTSISY